MNQKTLSAKCDQKYSGHSEGYTDAATEREGLLQKNQRPDKDEQVVSLLQGGSGGRLTELETGSPRDQCQISSNERTGGGVTKTDL